MRGHPLGIKASWGEPDTRHVRRRGGWHQVGPQEPPIVDGTDEDPRNTTSPIEPRTFAELAPVEPPADLSGADLVTWASVEAVQRLAELATDLESGRRQDLDPLAATVVLHRLRTGGEVPAGLLGTWSFRMRQRAEDPRVPWEVRPVDRALLAPVATFETTELLLQLAGGAEWSVAKIARSLFEELQTSVEDHLAAAIMADDPHTDTLVLWLLTQHALSLEEFLPLAVALATRYAVIARRVDGLLYPARDGADPQPLIPASARLARGLWALGIYPSLLRRIVSQTTAGRRPDGAWSERRSRTEPDLISTLTAAELLTSLDPDFDPEPTIRWIISRRQADGWWRHADREAPWLTVTALDWLQRATLPFVERFAWPAVPKPSRDRKTGQPRYEYLVDLARAWEEMDGLKGRAIDVAFCDLAHFGTFNKEHGQAAGDDVLRHFTVELQAACPWARLIRDGGDEFVLVGTPTWTGLRDAIAAFSETWPAAFAARFGTDATPVVPRFTGLRTRTEGLMAARERLGIRIGELKAIEPGPTGIVDWA
jgi:GGDEF domain-containing protein